jgi:hypothetical protein
MERAEKIENPMYQVSGHAKEDTAAIEQENTNDCCGCLSISCFFACLIGCCALEI